MITIQANQIMIEQYNEVLHVTSNEIHLRMNDHILHMKGAQLHVLALSKDEVLIQGKLEGLAFLYE